MDFNTGPSVPMHCLVRQVSADFANCLRENNISIDVDTAVKQHRTYVSLLERVVERVTFVPLEGCFPDSVYIEDVAVITGEHALVTCPGAPSRQGEVAGIQKALEPFCTVHQAAQESTLDGGDVMRLGENLVIGLSERTNRAGAEQLAKMAALDGLKTHIVEVRDGLHLKSAMTAIDGRSVIYDPAVFQPMEFPDIQVEWVKAKEPLGANVLGFGEVVIVSQNAPATAQLLRDRGHRVELVNVGELHKGDGALTCMSLRIPMRGCWSV